MEGAKARSSEEVALVTQQGRWRQRKHECKNCPGRSGSSLSNDEGHENNDSGPDVSLVPKIGLKYEATVGQYNLVHTAVQVLLFPWATASRKASMH